MCEVNHAKYRVVRQGDVRWVTQAIIQESELTRTNALLLHFPVVKCCTTDIFKTFFVAQSFHSNYLPILGQYNIIYIDCSCK